MIVLSLKLCELRIFILNVFNKIVAYMIKDSFKTYTPIIFININELGLIEYYNKNINYFVQGKPFRPR